MQSGKTQEANFSTEDFEKILSNPEFIKFLSQKAKTNNKLPTKLESAIEDELDGIEKLNEALFSDNYERVRLLFEKGEIKPGYSGLESAANARKWNSVRAFLRHNPERVDDNPECARAYGHVFLLAAIGNMWEIVKLLLSICEKVELNWWDSQKEWSVLHYAVAAGKAKLAEEFLTKYKIDPNERISERGSTPLQVAFQYSQPEMVKLLLSHGAKPDFQTLKNNIEKTYCVCAFIKSYRPSEDDKEHIHHYRDVFFEAVKRNDAEIIKKLQEAGVGLEKDETEDVIKFLGSNEFCALEAYLFTAKRYDDQRETSYWKRVKKHDLLESYIKKLKACRTMDEIRQVYAELEKPKDNNRDKVSDYAVLNTARGGWYRFFSMDTTTVSRINDLRALIPVTEKKQELAR